MDNFIINNITKHLDTKSVINLSRTCKDIYQSIDWEKYTNGRLNIKDSHLLLNTLSYAKLIYLYNRKRLVNKWHLKIIDLATGKSDSTYYIKYIVSNNCIYIIKWFIRYKRELLDDNLCEYCGSNQMLDILYENNLFNKNKFNRFCNTYLALHYYSVIGKSPRREILLNIIYNYNIMPLINEGVKPEQYMLDESIKACKLEQSKKLYELGFEVKTDLIFEAKLAFKEDLLPMIDWLSLFDFNINDVMLEKIKNNNFTVYKILKERE